jgi:hypothetical protein
MRRAALLVLVSALAGCGGSGDRAVSRSTPTPPATHSEIERFAHITLPPSARQIESKFESSMDTSLTLRFVMDRRDVDSFVKSARFTPPLARSYQPYASHELGWKLEKIKHRLGGEDDVTGGIGRWLTIDLDKPDVATVYLIASET